MPFEWETAGSTRPPETVCQPNEWQCDNLECINADFLCDSTRDCVDGSDESEEVCRNKEGNSKWKAMFSIKCLINKMPIVLTRHAVYI